MAEKRSIFQTIRLHGYVNTVWLQLHSTCVKN